MKKSRILAVLAVGLVVASGVGVAVSQPPSGSRAAVAPRGPEIVLIDVGKLFKESARFKQYMGELQNEMQKAEERFKIERDDLRKMMDALKEYKAGSREYDDLDRQITDRKARLSVDVELQRKEFMKREAKIYYAVYQQIYAEVEAYATANGIAAVLKFNSENPDVEKPDEILRDLQKPVLWYHQALDITVVIQQAMDQRVQRSIQNPARTGAGGFPPPPRR